MIQQIVFESSQYYFIYAEWPQVFKQNAMTHNVKSFAIAKIINVCLQSLTSAVM